MPLGGTDRVGMNATLIGQGGRYILVDLGATFVAADDPRGRAFADAHGGEIERIVPDLGAVAPLLDSIEGIVLTHAHQDHIGALPSVLASEIGSALLSCPIYATRYTAGMVAAAFDESPAHPYIRVVAPATPVAVGPFRIRWIPVTHSAPETMMVAIETDHGTVVIGTDIKNDPRPLLGPRTDFEGLAKLGDAGVLAFLADSTNAHRPGRSRSEAEVRDGFAALMAAHPGRVIISTFSSNLSRLVAAHEAAETTGRSVGILGRSLVKSVRIARETGLITDAMRLHGPDELSDCPDAHSVLVCTGTQAEEGSALRGMVDRLASGGPGLRQSDLFIHSARTIPGNEHSVNEMLEAMRRHGLRVVTAEEGAVHATGHGYRDELADFYEALRPRHAVPVHGTRDLIGQHLDLARRFVPPERALSPREGEILELTWATARIVGRVATGILAEVRIGGRSGRTRLVPWSESVIETAA